MADNTAKWKYNAAKHSVDEQPTMKEPDKHDFHFNGSFNRAAFNNYVKQYEEHIASLRSISVSGEVDWKDGEDVTGKFKVIDNQYEPPFCLRIKQEQPHKEYWQPSGNIPNSNWQPDTIEKQIAERIAGYLHEIDSLRITNRELGKKIESDAVEFGEWIDKDYANYGNHGKYSWSKKFPNQNTMIQVTTKELYKLFKNKQ